MERIYWNEGWEFTENFDESIFQKETELTKVRIPHSVKEVPLHYFDESEYQMLSGYRKVVMIPEEWRGKNLLLTFEGVAHDCVVYVNGREVAAHHCGYTAFTVNLKDLVEYGKENQIVLSVDSRETLNIPPFGFVIDYMTFGGVYRNVYLDVKEAFYLKDCFVKPQVISVKEKTAVLDVDVTLNQEEELQVELWLKKKEALEYEKIGEKVTQQLITTLQASLSDLALWDTEDPNLYELKICLWKEGVQMDEKIIQTGFRKAEFKKDGFYLNDRKFKIRGLNRHQSYPYVGYAMPKSMQIMDADILKKELGLNAVRTSHYPQSHDFLDRCEELGLLVFTEFPGWQHIGDQSWQDQAVKNVEEMVKEYRNHISIILWGVRINESIDMDTFYERTNACAHGLDSTRPTGGVRALQKSHLLEDVYTYNDFIHDGKHPGCLDKKKVTSNMEKPYLISEYNGHMFPTKAFDCEEHRTEHALRHACVLDAVASKEDIAGSFGWCMADYNTHKDFGSGDRICYHGVMDMFRNPKLAASVYASQQDEIPVLELSASMDIGEHPGCNRGNTYIFTNADAVRMYKNGEYVTEYRKEASEYKNLKHGPILMDDYMGDVLVTKEKFKKKQAEYMKDVLNTTAKVGMNNLPFSAYLKCAWLILRYHMKFDDAVDLYTRYIGDWGGTSTEYRLDAIKDGKVVQSLTKKPMTKVSLQAKVDHTDLVEEHSYDVAAIRIQAVDERDNLLSFYQEPVFFRTEGPIELIGPEVVSLHGGMGGTYIKTTGESGAARLFIKSSQTEEVVVEFEVEREW